MLLQEGIITQPCFGCILHRDESVCHRILAQRTQHGIDWFRIAQPTEDLQRFTFCMLAIGQYSKCEREETKATRE